MSRDEFGVGMAIFSAAFGKDYPVSTLEIFYGLLRDLNAESFLAAIQALCQAQKELYPNTNIVALIRDKVVTLESDAPAPEEAWEEIVRAADNESLQYNLHQNIERAFKVAGIKWHLIRPGGGFCLPDEQIGFFRKDFLKFYSAFAQKSHQDKIAPLPLADSIQELIDGIGDKISEEKTWK